MDVITIGWAEMFCIETFLHSIPNRFQILLANAEMAEKNVKIAKLHLSRRLDLHIILIVGSHGIV